MFFSHEAVEGFHLWGFWDQAMWAQDASLADGPDCLVSMFMVCTLNRTFDEMSNDIVLSKCINVTIKM